MLRRIAIVIVLMGASFGGGYWYEHAQYSAAEKRANALSAQLSEANATVALYHLQEELFTLVQDTANQNYGNAAALSTKFFDDVRAQIAQTRDPNIRSALQSIQDQRDAVTAGLAKADPKVHDLLAHLLDNFRTILAQAHSGQPA